MTVGQLAIYASPDKQDGARLLTKASKAHEMYVIYLKWIIEKLLLRFEKIAPRIIYFIPLIERRSTFPKQLATWNDIISKWILQNLFMWFWFSFRMNSTNIFSNQIWQLDDKPIQLNQLIYNKIFCIQSRVIMKKYWWSGIFCSSQMIGQFVQLKVVNFSISLKASHRTG